MPRTWTEAQQTAIRMRDRTLLVSAAAGSGKTATLTERVIQSLTDPEHPVDIDRILIVTYTKAAAAELKQRISDALTAQLTDNPSNTRLYRQILNLSNAHIGTIDSFCLSAVRAHFADVGFPASLRIADQAELEPICEHIMERLIDSFYHNYAPESTSDNGMFSMLENNPFADLCDCLTPAKNDAKLVSAFLEFYKELLNFPEGLERLRRESEQLLAQASLSFFESDHGGILHDWLTEFCRSALEFYEDACVVLAADEKAAVKYLPAFEHDKQFLHTLKQTLDGGNFEEVQALFASYEKADLLALPKPDPAIAEAKIKRAEYVAEIKKFQETFFTVSLPIRTQMEQSGLMCRILYEFLSQFDREIMAEKRARGICDFFDVSRLMLGMLQTADGQPTPLSDEYAARFDQVYIDEYQDVNQVQDRIFSLIGRDHRFMVGDIKQSIYGFRGADPSVFARYRRELPSVFHDPATGAPSQSTPATGGSIFMSDNFRCDESVIRVTNAICGHCFRACPDSIGYHADDDLGFSKKPPEEQYVSPKVQIDVLTPVSKKDKAADATDSEVGNVAAEAMHVANRVAELLRTPTPLANGQPIRPSDIAILVRSKSNLSDISAAMTAMGIPTGCEELQNAEEGQTLLRGREMMYWMNLLRVIDNPHKDIPLAELVRSPFPGLSLEDVVTLRCLTSDPEDEASSMSLYQAMERYVTTTDKEDALHHKLAAFLEWLGEYRRLSSVLAADGLLRLLRQDPHCACRKSKAFLFLYDHARTYRGAAFADLYSFLAYFERLLQTQKSVKTAADGKSGGHVTLMTIHGSKGLEFPVCFVIQCGKSFSAQSLKADLLFEPRAGVSFKLFNRSNGQRYNTLLRSCSALEIKLREREDEMRLMYVAMTRARERLYLCGVGTIHTHEKPSYAATDRFSALSSGNYLGWILAAWKEHPEIGEWCDISYPSLPDIQPQEPLTYHSAEASESTANERSLHYRRILESRPQESELDYLLRSVPTKVSASHFADGLLDSCVFTPGDPVLSRESNEQEAPPDLRSLKNIEEAVRLLESSDGANDFELLLKANQKPTAAEKGTAVHLFLQYCDFKRVVQNGTINVEEELNRLLEEGFLSERTAAIINKRLLENFFKSQFFARLTTADSIGREVRFNRFVPLCDLTANPALAERLGNRTLYVQGSIDLLLTYPDGSIDLCDYKTDAISPEERADLSLLRQRFAEKHGAQLKQYALAVRDLYHRVPRHIYIYSLPLGEAVEIDVNIE